MSSKNEKGRPNISGHQEWNASAPVDHTKHKREVQRQRMIKRKRKMKMTDRGDDIYRDPKDSEEEFVVSDLPEEVPQDFWLNDLLGPPSSQMNTARPQESADASVEKKGSEKQLEQLEESKLKHEDNAKEQQVFKPESSSLVSKAVNTLVNQPAHVVILVFAIIVLQWFHQRSKKG